MRGAGEVCRRQGITLMLAEIVSLGSWVEELVRVVRRLAGALARQTSHEDTSHHWHFLWVIISTHQCHLLQVSIKHITVTSSRYIYSSSLSPPAGIFSTHHYHLLQVYLQHITATFSCPSGCKKHFLLVKGVYYQCRWKSRTSYPISLIIFVFLKKMPFKHNPILF